MAYHPVLGFIYLGAFILGLPGLVLSMIGLGWFVTHPKEPGDSSLRGKRGVMFALCIVAIPVTVICALVFLLFVFGT